MYKPSEIIKYAGGYYRLVEEYISYHNAIYKLASLAEKEVEKLFKEILPETGFAGHVFMVYCIQG